MPNELDVVELRVTIGPWGPGARGTVTHVSDACVEVEFADDKGRTTDMIEVPFNAVKVMESPDHDMAVA
jgi:hypothetical protein